MCRLLCRDCRLNSYLGEAHAPLSTGNLAGGSGWREGKSPLKLPGALVPFTCNSVIRNVGW